MIRRPDNVIKQGRLHGAIDKYFSSPVAADDKVFLIGEGGEVSVLKAAGDWQVLRVNELDDECLRDTGDCRRADLHQDSQRAVLFWQIVGSAFPFGTSSYNSI